jgi:hypothetical protein
MIIKASFKARAHLLKLLGDQLIGNDRLAVFELIKNSYDADATYVKVLLDLDSLPPFIRITDNGCGMDKDVLLKKWMELGTDSKRGKDNRKHSPAFNRLPLGEKGVGRLAVHKLGTKLKMVTKTCNGPEYSLNINWPALIDNSNYLEEAAVIINEDRSNKELGDIGHGTIVEVTGLYKIAWTRAEVRNLYKLATSIVSPFNAVSDFSVVLEVPGRESWLTDLPDVSDILERAVWQYKFILHKNGKFEWNYKFNPPGPFKSIDKTVVSSSVDEKLELLEKLFAGDDNIFPDNLEDKLILTGDMLDGIGAISGVCYFFHRRKEVLNAEGAYQHVVKFLDEQTGVRIYRDGVRVFNYGEQEDDWLGLNSRRINTPGKYLGTNSVIAAIELSLKDSNKLEEKTNREGFDENIEYRRMRLVVSSIFEKFFILHRRDRKKIEDYLDGVRSSKKPSPEDTFDAVFTELQSTIEKEGLKDKLGNKISFIGTEYKRMREVTLNAGLKGLNLSIIFHEVEREIISLNKAIHQKESDEQLAKRSEQLVKLLEGFQPLLRRNEVTTFDISKVILNSTKQMENRLKYHGVVLSAPVLTGENEDFQITAPYGLILASMQNLLDNAIHWSRLRAEKGENTNLKPAIGIFTMRDWFEEGPAIVIADNGPGFSLSPEEAVAPFVTERPGGSGLGLYYVNMVMENTGGRLLILTPDELELPAAYDGAAVVMLFKGAKR